LLPKNSDIYTLIISNQILPPAPPLQPYIERYVSLQGHYALHQHIVPQLRVALVFDFLSNTQYNQQSLPFAAVGLQEKPYDIRGTSGHHDKLIVHFTSIGCSAFTRMPVHHFSNRIIPASDLFGPGAQQLFEQLYPLPLVLRIKKLDEFFIRSLRRLNPLDQSIYEMANNMQDHIDPYQIDSYKQFIPTVTRNTERRFLQLTGANCRKYIKLARFKKAWTLLQGDAINRVTDIAYSAGYFDQSHFNRHFKELAGIAPTDYLHFLHSHPTDLSVGYNVAS
jgi:AraC-like DNA-binding protein